MPTNAENKKADEAEAKADAKAEAKDAKARDDAEKKDDKKDASPFANAKEEDFLIVTPTMRENAEQAARDEVRRAAEAARAQEEAELTAKKSAIEGKTLAQWATDKASEDAKKKAEAEAKGDKDEDHFPKG